MKISCPRCRNEDKNYFVELGGKYICRKCIGFVGDSLDSNYVVNEGEYKINYELTKEQRAASDFVLKNVVENKNCAINAVCGAGKTEIIYDTLKYCLNNNLKIGIAIPRKDVVVELANRIKQDFNVSVVPVYGGNHEVISGDIIIFTTHQAFRYIGYFDVLIIDEVDAFPYKNNDVLRNMISGCSKTFVYLSATMPKEIVKNKLINKYYLNKRYHGYKLPVPKCKVCFSMLFCLKKTIKKYKNKVIFVYFPTINIQNKIVKKIKCDYLVNSKSENRDTIINNIKKLEKGVIFTTTVLERGITVKDVQVIVYNAEHKLFNKDTLIQISGRVGRNKLHPFGDIIFICKTKNRAIKSAINTLNKCNE